MCISPDLQDFGRAHCGIRLEQWISASLVGPLSIAAMITALERVVLPGVAFRVT